MNSLLEFALSALFLGAGRPWMLFAPLLLPTRTRYQLHHNGPKRISVEPRSRRAPKGFVGSTYDALTSPENAAVVRSIALFGAVVTFLSSSWGEILLPPQ
ncbi:hypothetical protein FCULG_00011535 [Fusarium culmorum]|uniref:TOM core complex subunit Tom6 n=1 Tax=Fusarium culmorum TaxID=5516 RepID=A0A2T4H5H6_FUSCU|nr:hypothetical protein FCULG_00011535 [Fusarium culmorum]